jgi:hypothetical protein
VLHVLSLALWCGGAVFFSFLAAPRIFGYLRDQLPHATPPGLEGVDDAMGLRLAGNTVGAIFPAYFAGQVVLGVLAVAAGAVRARGGLWLDKIRCACIAAALAIVSLHALTVYPHSVRELAEHYQAKDGGDEPAAAALRKTFGMWHGVSQLLNLVTIALVVASVALVGVVVRRE